MVLSYPNFFFILYQTTIISGRRGPNAGEGFVPAYHPFWGPRGWSPDGKYPEVLQFDYSTGTVTLADFTIHVTDGRPVDPRTDFYGNENSIVISQVIDIQVDVAVDANGNPVTTPKNNDIPGYERFKNKPTAFIEAMQTKAVW